MAVPPIPTAFSAFNARNLDPSQVAKSFIPSTHFQTLAKHAHSYVVGPRGSGKTTLLKMLHPAALEAWAHPQANAYRDSIKFAGVFVPADMSWNTQLLQLQPSPDTDGVPALGYSAFTTHLLRSLLDTMQHRTSPLASGIPHLRVEMSVEKEKVLVEELCTAWQIKAPIPTLQSLRNVLGRRLLEIHAIARKKAFMREEVYNSFLAEQEYLHLEMLSSVVCGIDAFQSALSDGCKWALLFDELELAPQWLLRTLIRAVRNADTRLLFKLSLSPYIHDPAETEQVFTSVPTHDYDPIRLWFPNKEEGYSFSQELVHSLIADESSTATASSVFGTSLFEADSASQRDATAYRPGSKQAKHFQSLYDKDASFQAFCVAHDIDITFEKSIDAIERAAQLRKIISLVIVRDLLRAQPGQGGKKTRLRSRKNPELYFGETSIYAVSEGNPRWLKAIITPLLHAERTRDPGELSTIDPRKQGDEIRRARQRFRALLKTIPSPPVRSDARPRGVLSLLDTVGNYFKQGVIDNAFSSEPALSFTVDARADEKLVEAIGRALNAGAIVWVPDDAGEAILTSFRGKRFRLSYLLATEYNLPLMLGNPISLSTILERSRVGDRTLFDEGGE
jgi:hypothetical protein